MLAGAMIQSALLAGNSGGIALAVDIEMGFTDRLLAAPISRFAIVAGRLAGTAALGALTAVWFLAIGLIFGATIEEGVLGALVMIVLVVAVGARVRRGSARRSRSGPAAPRSSRALFPLVFVILFLSTAFFPADLLLEPAPAVAEYNPLSFIVDGRPRPGDLGVSGRELLEGLGRDRARSARSGWRSARWRCERRLRIG